MMHITSRLTARLAQSHSGFTLIEVAVAMVVLTGAAIVGGMAMDAIERTRGYRNTVVDATIIAQNETERICAVNRCGFVTGDTSYSLTCNRLNYTVMRTVGKPNDLHSATPVSDRRTIITVTAATGTPHTWTFSLTQEPLDEH